MYQKVVIMIFTSFLLLTTPTYANHTNTTAVIEKIMPAVVEIFSAAPNLGDSTKLEMTKGLPKPTEEFNHILKRIKRNNPGSTIEVRD